MKKLILFLILTLTYSLSFSQADTKYEIYCIDFSSKITNDVKKCDAGKKQALLDVKDGEYNYIVFERNYNKKSDFQFNKYYHEYMMKKYHIKFLNLIATRDFTKCYSIEMNKIIFKKYGEDIISKSKKEALIEYQKNKPK